MDTHGLEWILRADRLQGYHAMRIIVDDLTGPEIAALLEAHTAELRTQSPPESKHAFDITQLRRPDITMWTVWDGDLLVGCGALQDLGNNEAELKSMRVVSTHTGQGIASRLLAHILDDARARGFSRVSLETGSMAFFHPAHRLYARHGFIPSTLR